MMPAKVRDKRLKSFLGFTKKTLLERTYEREAMDTLLELHRRLRVRGPFQRHVVTDAFIRWLVAERNRPLRYNQNDRRLLTEFVRFFRLKMRRKGGPKT